MSKDPLKSARGGRQDVLQTLLDFVAALAGLVVPWAPVAAAGAKAMVEFKKHAAHWNPKLPAPGSGKEDVYALERAVLADPPPGVDREAIQELFGYRTLRRLYPDLESRWLVQTSDGLPLAPFIEEWSSLPDPATPAVPMRLVPQFDEYALPVAADALGQRVDELVRSKLMSDDPKLRICAASGEGDGLKLGYSVCHYSEILRSHWAVANLDPDSSEALRRQLCGVGDLWPLEQSRCPNGLGVSAIVVCQDRLVLPKSTERVIASPRRRVPSASGSADFMPHHWQSPPSPVQDILRETREELGIDINDFRDVNVRLLGFTRNVLRGGKPEAFYYVHMPSRFRGSMASFEHEKDSMIKPLSLLSATNKPLPEFADRLQAIEALMRQPSTHTDPISPFTRVALHYYVQFARGCERAYARSAE